MKRLLTDSEAKSFPFTLSRPVKTQPEYNGFTGCWKWSEKPDPYEMKGIRSYAEGALVQTLLAICPYSVGDVVALTETWGWGPWGAVLYKSNSCRAITEWPKLWRSACTMPAEFARYKGRITSVAVEHGELWTYRYGIEEVRE